MWLEPVPQDGASVARHDLIESMNFVHNHFIYIIMVEEVLNYLCGSTVIILWLDLLYIYINI